MFENIINFFKNIGNKEAKKQSQTENSKDAAKERLHLVLMQDRANVSADFLELMKQEIIDVIKKYIEVDEKEIDVRLTNQENEDGTNGAPALYANIPILNIKNNSGKIEKKEIEKELKQEDEKEEIEEVKQEEKDNNSDASDEIEKKEMKTEKDNKKENEIEEKAKEIIEEENKSKIVEKEEIKEKIKEENQEQEEVKSESK